MTVDIYNYFQKNPGFNKLEGPDYLFVEYKCPIEVEQFRFWTDAHMLNYVISGKKDWMTSEQTYHLNQGDAVLIQKGVFATKQYFEEDYCVMLFFISDDFITRFLNDNPDLKVTDREKKPLEQIIRVDVDDSLESLFVAVFNYFKKGGAIPHNLVEIKFRELLFNLILNPKNHELARFFARRRDMKGNDLEEVMLRNFLHDLSMESYARLSGRSLSSFKRDFREHFGDSPGKWLIKKRLEFASGLLKSSDLDVNQVAYESGFKNPSHFNKAYKKLFEVTPQQYRKQHQVS